MNSKLNHFERINTIHSKILDKYSAGRTDENWSKVESEVMGIIEDPQ